MRRPFTRLFSSYDRLSTRSAVGRVAAHRVWQRRRGWFIMLAGALLVLALAPALQSSSDTFVVTNTEDGGPGSLRQAIVDANASPGTDRIVFDIAPSSGSDRVQTISPLTPLPEITESVAIDGTTQPGYDGAPLIELEGSQAESTETHGLQIGAPNCAVRGLVINRFGGAGIVVAAAGADALIADNYIGTASSGSEPLGNTYGVWVQGASSNTVRGNLISGNGVGIWLDAASTASRVQNNTVGLDVSGDGAIGNVEGIVLDGATDSLVDANLVSGNFGTGIRVGSDAFANQFLNNGIGINNFFEPVPNGLDGLDISGGSNNAVRDNLIAANAGAGVLLRGAGTRANVLTGNTVIANGTGVDIQQGSSGARIGGATAAEGNTITGSIVDGVAITGNGTRANVLQNNAIQGSGRYGVAVFSAENSVVGNRIQENGLDGVFLGSLDGAPYAVRVSIRTNAISNNGDLGIRLDGKGATGGNNLQPAPTLSLAAVDGSRTRVAGTLIAAPGKIYDIQFFVNSAADPSGFGEGEAYLGSLAVTTNANGVVDFVADLPAVAEGQAVTATATDPDGNTSEFSNAASAGSNVPGPTLTSLDPDAAKAGGPEFTLTVNGLNFVPGSVVRWNGAPRPTQFTSETRLTAAISAEDIATAGVVSVTVFNPEPAPGMSSNALPFVIDGEKPETIIVSGPAEEEHICGGSVTFTWKGTDNVTPADRLQFQWRMDEGAWSEWSAGTSHEFTGLSEGTHRFAVRARDEVGNVDDTPAARRFRTDVTPPIISNVVATPAATSVVITWTTDEPATSQVDYGKTNQYGTSTPKDVTLKTEHSVTINGLDSNVTYHFRVRSADKCGHERVSGGSTFTTIAPDLQVTAADPPSEVWTERAFGLNWTDTNRGLVRADGPWVDRVYLSGDDQLGGDTLLNEFPYSGQIAPGQSIPRSQDITIPRAAIVEDGTYYLIIVTDATNTVPEGSLEGNNFRVVPLTVRRLPRPDLTVETIEAPETAFFDQTITVRWTVKNIGNASTDASEWHDRLFLSLDRVPDAQDAWQLDVENVSYLAAGDSYVASANVRIPRGLFGDHFVIVKTDSHNAVGESDEANNVFVRERVIRIAVPPLPDLQVPLVQAPEEAFAGQPMFVNWRVENRGTGNTPPDQTAWFDRVYLSQDETFDPAVDRLIGERRHEGGLPQNAGYDVSGFSVNVPGNIAGDWYVFVWTDADNGVYEFTQENNNTNYDRRRKIRIRATPPDLVVPTTQVTVNGGGGATSGGVATVAWTVRNQGAFEAPGSWQDGVYLSADATLDRANDRLLASVGHTGPLGAGESYAASTQVRLPDCDSGTYYVIVATDNTNTVFEFDPGFDAEGNNFGPARPLVIERAAADLRVTRVSNPPSGSAGQPVPITWTVTNRGTHRTNASSWTDTVYLNASSTFNAATALTAGSFTHTGALDSGASYTRTENVTLPITAQGTYYVFVVTDSGDGVEECDNEENNTGSGSGTITVNNQLPDLTINGVDAPPAAFVGQTISVRWTGANTGTADAQNPAWNDGVYLSQNETLDGSDRRIGTALIRGPLAVGEPYGGVVPQIVLPLVPPGDYYLIVQSDSDNHVFEGQGESNNERAVPIRLTIADVDLEVAGVSAPPTSFSGQEMTVSWTVRNNGTAESLAAAWSDYVILSRDQILDATDRVIGFRAHASPIPAGGTYTASVDAEVPPGLSGPYYVFVRTDWHNAVPETNEFNNVGGPAGVLVQLPPPVDLVVTQVNAPPSGSPGETATLRWTVANQGKNTAVGRWRDAVYLSLDRVWDIDDTLVGRVDHDGPLPNGQSYSGELTADLPAVTPGRYYVLVRTDVRNRVPEDNERNNTTASAGTMKVDVVELALGVPFETSLWTNKERYFKVNAPASETMLLTLDAAKNDSSTELFARYGQMASRSAFDFLFTRPYDPDQEIVVPDTLPGFYFGMARGAYVNGTTPATLKAEIIPFSIRSVSPRRIGDNGQVTITLRGAKFANGQMVRLTQGNAKQTATNVWAPDSATLKARFFFTNAMHGVYDVTVTNQSGTTINAPQPITIETASRIAVTVDALGDTTPRFGRPFNASAGLQNISNVDVPYVNVIIYMEDNVVIRTLRPRNTIPAADTEVDGVPLTNSSDGEQTVDSFIVRDMEPGEILPIAVSVTGFTKANPLFEITALVSSASDFRKRVLEDIENARLYALATGQGFGYEEMNRAAQSEASWRAFWLMRLDGVGLEDGGRGPRVLGPGGITPAGPLDFILNPCRLLKPAELLCAKIADCGARCACGLAVSFVVGSCNLIRDSAKCAAIAVLIPPGGVSCETAMLLKFLGSRALALARFACCVLECQNQNRTEPCRWYPKVCDYAVGAGVTICPRRASDPNDKSGPSGFGPQAFTGLQQPWPYTINFENVPAATAAAQRIRITDQLDPALNWRTFRLKEIGFGNYRIPVPENRAFFTGRIQLGEDLGNLIAEVSAGVDIATGQVTWTLTAIDPKTGEQPNSALLGLLPPNDPATNNGQGYVTYTIQPKAGTPTGTVIKNSATITFDTEEPITTNAVTNTVDGAAPMSTVAALPANVPDPTFTLSWSGGDDVEGSGLQSYDIWVAENDGPFQPLLTGTTDTTAAYTGIAGRTYRFYSVARDNAGNVEAAPDTPDATTRIGPRDNPRPRLRALEPNAVAAGGSAFTLTINGAGFVPNSVVQWNGVARTTAYVSATQITAAINAADIARAGSATITVVNPPPGGGVSNALVLTIGTPRLSLSNVSNLVRSGDTITATLHLTNTGTAPAADVQINGSTLGTAATTTRPLPGPVTILANSTVTVTLTYPAAAGSPGATVFLQASGKFRGGGFNTSRRVVLP